MEKERILLIDTHSDHCLSPPFLIEELGLHVVSPSIGGIFGSIYRYKPKWQEISWLEPNHNLYAGKRSCYSHWHILKRPEGQYDHVDIDVDGLKSWDNSPYNVAFNGGFGTVPVEMAERAIGLSNARSLSLVELFHGCGGEKYKEWLASEEALESARQLVKRVQAPYNPDLCFSVLYREELECRFKKRGERVKENFEALGDSIRAEKLYFEATSERELIQEGLGHYVRVRGSVEEGERVMVISNTHAAAWLTKGPEFTFEVPEGDYLFMDSLHAISKNWRSAENAV